VEASGRIAGSVDVGASGPTVSRRISEQQNGLDSGPKVPVTLSPSMGSTP